VCQLLDLVVDESRSSTYRILEDRTVLAGGTENDLGTTSGIHPSILATADAAAQT
jgi:hypothetical protein